MSPSFKISKKELEQLELKEEVNPNEGIIAEIKRLHDDILNDSKLNADLQIRVQRATNELLKEYLVKLKDIADIKIPEPVVNVEYDHTEMLDGINKLKKISEELGEKLEKLIELQEENKRPLEWNFTLKKNSVGITQSVNAKAVTT